MNYYYIRYYFETFDMLGHSRKYDGTVFVKADTFELACEKIKNQTIHKNDKIISFSDLTIT